MMILGSCPDITNLYYRTPGDISLWEEGTGYVSACKKLSNLQLCYRDMYYRTLCFHLSFCPNLRRLILKSSSTEPLGNPSSGALTKFCPELKILGLGCTEGLPDLEDFKCSTSQKGIEYMAIEFNQHFIPIESAKHINAQSKSLRQLSIIQTKQWKEPFGVYTAPTSSSPTYNNLSALYYKSQRFDDISILTFVQQPNSAFGRPRDNFGARNRTPVSVEQEYIGAIIESSPNLADLSLVGGSFSVLHIRTPLEQAVKEKIRVLTLNSAFFRDTSVDWYKSFYSSFNRVHTLVIQEVILHTGVISSLAASESIQHLTIAKCGNFKHGELADFFKGVALRPSHRLSTFDICNMSASIEVSTIRHLITIKSLATIRIAKVRNINFDAVEHLIGNATYSSLRTIEILNCFPADTISSWSGTIDRVNSEGIACRIE
ncbi:hypothetical protein BJV82DRAFT_66829 [Fennellomyces sp. T-0311]|nr:hypothetical protein BJV82DRAFT_66829 [Fennellomyces sp. T-0311]